MGLSHCMTELVLASSKMDPSPIYVPYKAYGKIYVKISYNKDAKDEINTGFKILIHLTY